MMEETKRNNPWLGLESYKEGEILYGRDEDIRDLTQSVLNDTDTLLYGRSGIGKSSILNAGVIPAARRNGFQPVLVRFSHKEQHSYLHQIREVIAKDIDIREVVPCKDEDKESLYEFFHRHTFHGTDGERVKLLVIIDQFEEIFTLQENEQKKKRFFAELADLLNDVKPTYMQNEVVKQADNQEVFDLSDANAFDNLFDALDLGGGTDTPDYVIDNEIHMVFTIREDFLSEFEYYTASIPSLKQNRYGLRPINENQAAQIILNPVPGLIDKEVARLVIEKVTGRSDFSLDGNPEIEVDSAVLSLYLNRLYEAKEDEHITAQLVEQKGGEIIADFYIDAISGISESTVEYLEDMLLNGQNRRDNITVFDAINDGHATEEELDILCNKKKILRQFNYAGDLRIEYVHDILCPVVKAHKDERMRLKEEEEERRRQEEEKQRILREEEEKRREIERKAEAERAEMQAQALRAKRRNRSRLITLGLMILPLLALILGLWWRYGQEHKSYYAAFERVNGWPKGVGKPLTKEERNKTPLYYKLTHIGHLDHDTDVEVCSSNGALPIGKPRIATLLVNDKDMGDEKAKAYYDLLCKVKSIHFIEADGKVCQEIYFDESRSILFIINYFHLDNGKEAWCQFMTPDGKSMPVRENGTDRIKLSWYENKDGKKDPFNGYVESLRFYDASGLVSYPAADSICGYAYRFIDENTRYRYALDEYGRPQQAVYNVVMTRKDGEKEEVTYGKVISINDSILEAPGPQGYGKAVTQGDVTQFYLPDKDKPIATREVKRDDLGNVKEEKNKGDLPIPALVKYSYDPKTGYMTSIKKLDAKGNPFLSLNDSIYKKHWQYSDNGEQTLEEHWDVNDKRVYFHQVTHDKDVTTDQLEDVAKNEYLTRIDSTFADHASTTYYGKGNKPVNHKTVEGEDTIYCHRLITKLKDGISTMLHFTFDEKKGAIIPCPKQLNDYGKATSYYCREERFDNEGNLAYYRLLDVDGTVIKSMMRFYQNGQEVARAVMGVDGNPVRCHKWEEEGYAYYKLYYSKDYDSKYLFVKAVDEWEAPSVFFDDKNQKYQSISYNDYQGAKIILGDETTTLRHHYKQYYLDIAKDITKVQLPYLHILDKKSTLYAAGLRDGDRIIGLGSWKQGMANTLFESQWQKMENSSMTITVLRPKGRGFETITKELTRGDANQEECHILALTIDEEEQINKYLNP
ncbi:MAG: ATP-binding protein [Prevotella sp.]|nr:ATP-binding protein [Prevotella sp.]